MYKLLQECITVDRSVAECFAYLRDFSTIEQWDPGVYRAEKLDPGAPAVGSQYRVVLALPGKRAEMHYTQQVIEENRRLVLSGVGANFSASDTIEFNALGPQQTTISYRAELRLDWLPARSAPLLSPLLNGIGRKAVAGLHNALSPPAAPPPRRWGESLKQKLLLPAMRDFGERGYLAMPRKAHSHTMQGKTVLVTGPTGGLGLAAACELARLGAELILLGRDAQKLAASQNQIIDFAGARAATIHCHQADFSSLADTARAARQVAAQHPRIDALFNNAGALFDRHENTAEGLERSVAVNLLAPLLLCRLLSPTLHSHSRVINVVSGGMYLQGLVLDDMHYRRPPFNGSKAYARAKRALFTMTEQLAAAAGANGPRYQAMHPGWAATPGVAKSLPEFNKRLQKRLRDARMGADTMVWLASAPELAEVPGGQLWLDRRPRLASVLPGTGVNAAQRAQLSDWVEQHLSPFCQAAE